MGDADGRMIPIVEGDQGEGFKDPLDLDDVLKILKTQEEEAWKLLQRKWRKEEKLRRKNSV